MKITFRPPAFKPSDKVYYIKGSYLCVGMIEKAMYFDYNTEPRGWKYKIVGEEPLRGTIGSKTEWWEHELLSIHVSSLILKIDTDTNKFCPISSEEMVEFNKNNTK